MSTPGDRSIPGSSSDGGKGGGKTGSKLGFVIIGLVILSGFVGCTIAVSSKGSTSDPYTPDASSASITSCENSIKDRLKSPSTAKFVDDVTGSNPYTVAGTVDSENSFGASLRSSFQCTVTAETTTVDYLN